MWPTWKPQPKPIVPQPPVYTDLTHERLKWNLYFPSVRIHTVTYLISGDFNSPMTAPVELVAMSTSVKAWVTNNGSRNEFDRWRRQAFYRAAISLRPTMETS